MLSFKWKFFEVMGESPKRCATYLAVSFTRSGLSITIILMGIFRALGFGLFILILALLMPTVLAELTRTIVIFLQSSSQAFMAAGVIASYAGHIPGSLH